MPRDLMDYSRTIIYKIVCNDLSITECYVGHTTNFIKRKNAHKTNCNNEKGKYYNLNVYQFIRENGNWENWNMVQIEKFSCENRLQACAKERYWIETLKAKLNSNIPNRTKREYNIQYYETNKDKLLEYGIQYRETNKEQINERHKQYYETNKDKRLEYQKQYNETNKEQINEKRNKKFNCEICGGKYTRMNKSHHEKTNLHQLALTQLESSSVEDKDITISI